MVLLHAERQIQERKEEINDPITLADTQIHRQAGERWLTNPFRLS